MNTDTVTARGARYCQCGQRLARDHAGSRCGACERRAVREQVEPPNVPAGFWDTQAFRDAFGAQHIGQVARAYRCHPFHASAYGRDGLSQALLGGWLGLTQPQVSRIENGPPIRNLDTLAHWARVLRIPPGLLWFKLPAAHTNVTQADYPIADSGGPILSGPDGDRLAGPDEAVAADQRAWRAARQYLNHHRSALAQQAVGLYPAELRVERTTLLARPSWLPPAPVDLAGITATWMPDTPPARISGTEPESQRLRPLRVPGHQFDRYTSAVRYLDPPRLFENRPSYRLLDLEWAGGTGLMRFGLGDYFAKLDISEAIGHEIASAASRLDGMVTGRNLPFRCLIGDPFDFRRRAILPAVTTLTLRRERARAGFLLHWRDPRKVATATRVFDVVPAGEFQPSSVAGPDLAGELDLWKNIVREFSEELLGRPEHDGSRGEPVDYEGWPLYRALSRARGDGAVAAFCLGAGVDALTLAATILTVVVIDADVFDELFAEAVRENSEGVIVLGEDGGQAGCGIEFSERNVSRLVAREPMAAPGAACLALAWRNRDRLLARNGR